MISDPPTFILIGLSLALVEMFATGYYWLAGRHALIRPSFPRRRAATALREPRAVQPPRSRVQRPTRSSARSPARSTPCSVASPAQ